MYKPFDSLSKTTASNRLSIRFFRFIKQLDYLQIVTMISLLIYGVVFIYGTGHQVDTDYAKGFWIKQITWIGVGFTIWILLALLNYRNIGYFSIIIYIASILALIFVLFFGKEVFNARRWIDLYFFRIQPSEFGKLAYLFLAAWIISIGFNINKFSTLLLLAGTAAIPFVLIIKEPDLGSGLVIIMILSVVLFVAGLKWRWLFLILLAIGILIPVTYPHLKNYQKARIETFLDSSKDLTGKGWNQAQAQLAVGSGGITGKGFMNGTQHTLGYIPQTVSNTDFIFSVIAEETGFLGSTLLVLCYMLLVTSAIRTAAVARDTFGRIVAVGIGAIFMMHSFINIGMSIRLAPVTGIPLPLVSYGGSFMISSMIYLGILQSIYLRKRNSIFSEKEETPVNPEAPF